MLRQILIYIDVVVLVQSLVLLVEVLVNVKRPGPIKILLLLCAAILIYRNFGQVYLDNVGYHRWLVELPATLLVLSALMFFSSLYQYRTKKYIIGFLGFVLFLQIFLLSLHSFILGYEEAQRSIDIKEFKVLRSCLRLIVIIGMFVIFIDLFKKIIEKYRSKNLYHAKLRKWSFLIAIHLFVVFIAGTSQTWLGLDSTPVRIFTSLATFSFIQTLIFRPKFLNNSSLKIAQGNLFNLTVVKEVSAAQFTDVFFDRMYFLNPEASLENLSKALDVDSDDLYRFVYNNYELTFNDLVNKNRVEYFVDLVRSQKFPHYTIDALAQESGFGSRHHLYKPFKKFHGGAPSDFVRSVST